MVFPSRKILIFCLTTLFFFPSFYPASGKGSKRVASRKWVVKLKQNSWRNKRPFQFAAPVVDDEQVYVGIQRKIFYAVNAKKGKKRWKFMTQGDVHAQPTVDDRYVYLVDIKGMVYALDKKEGKLVWATRIGSEVLSKPLLHNNQLYLVSLKKELFALQADNGHYLWQRKIGHKDSGFTIRGSSDPVLIRGLLVVGYSDGTLVAHDPENGTVRWVRQLGDPLEEFHDVDATILLGGNLAYVTSADGNLFALEPETGNTVWSIPVGSVNDVVLVEPFLYVTAGGVVHCFRSENGQSLWEQDLNLPETSSPVIYGNWLATVATKGQIYFIHRLTGDILHSWHVKGGSYSDPVLQGRRLYLLSNASRLYAFEFKEDNP